MRYFLGLLFLGCGDHSARLCKLLHKRLDEALILSGGLQQSSQGMPEDEPYNARLEAEREDAVRDLAASILGREVTFGQRLPYPYDDEATRLYAEKFDHNPNRGSAKAIRNRNKILASFEARAEASRAATNALLRRLGVKTEP